MSARKSRAVAGNPYAVLQAWDRLEVGPTRVEGKRIVTPYRVIVDGREETTELSFRWEEEVFSADRKSDRNLASMIGAQPALNYGLFCRELVFHGPFDRTDRRFLADMAENTAREILVKKFLEPNPFLVGPAASLEAQVLERYCHAQLVFPEPELKGAVRRADPLRPSSSRYVLLSSGGKESLLSFGLLEEMGAEVHPVYINESGRHWYTALNGYRHHKETCPATARVWTDVDRLYNWALRHMPFIRKDYQNVRADEYPVRLWTVCVLVFGALPLARKRGAARLLVGDEFDTTHRTRHQGIPHYDGLFDQSRYFDEALSRYYQSKGWTLCQFSLLRPLSELLIEKILVERYPHLQRHQVSCHAAHVDGDRAYPCGKCEKCRRIVGMLTVLDGDPLGCGYTEEQVRHCLDDLSKRPPHQEKEGAGHLAWLLQEKKVLAPRKGVRPYPEVMRLRFDAEHAPRGWIPADIRRKLLRIFLHHAEGAIERRQRRWHDAEPLTPDFLSATYRFDAPGPPEPGRLGEGESGYLLGELTWPMARDRLAEVDVALLPVGSIEQHGPHLPLDTDSFDADYSARAVAARCTEPRPLVLPLIPYGVSYHHEDFPGTLAIGPDTLSRLVYEVGMAAAAHGIRKLVIVNGHGGNIPALNFAAQLINRDARIFTCVESGDTSDVDMETISTVPNDVHAGDIETSAALAVRPELVRMDKAEAFVPKFSSKYLDFSSQRGVEWYARTLRLSPTGVLGDPTQATVEKGRRIWEVMIRHLVQFVEELKPMTLDEIHQRRL